MCVICFLLTQKHCTMLCKLLRAINRDYSCIYQYKQQNDVWAYYLSVLQTYAKRYEWTMHTFAELRCITIRLRYICAHLNIIHGNIQLCYVVHIIGYMYYIYQHLVNLDFVRVINYNTTLIIRIIVTIIFNPIRFFELLVSNLSRQTNIYKPIIWTILNIYKHISSKFSRDEKLSPRVYSAHD